MYHLHDRGSCGAERSGRTCAPLELPKLAIACFIPERTSIGRQWLAREFALADVSRLNSPDFKSPSLQDLAQELLKIRTLSD